jgi:hypothetical protein
MNKFFYSIVWYILTLQLTFADWGFLWDFVNERNTSTWSESTEEALRNWDIHVADIPNIIKWSIDFFITIAWTIAIIFIIIWAYKILLGSLEQDKTKWKDTIIMAIGWFALASLAWFIVKLLIDNLWEWA